MSRIVINGDVVLKRNNATDAQGVAIPPTVESMNYGEIAINYNAKDACIFIKALDANGQQKIVKFVGEEVIVKTLGDILGESAADLATLKEMLSLFEGSSNDVLTLVKNLQTEVALKANKTYVDSELAKKLGKTETAADSSKLGGIAAADYWRNSNSGTTSYDWAAKNIKAAGVVTIGTVEADGTHKLIVAGSVKSSYYRFASQSGLANQGYIGCGTSANNNIYLVAENDLTINAGQRTSGDIYIPRSGPILVKRNIEFEANTYTKKAVIETRITSSVAGNLMAFEDASNNNGNAVLCGINDLGVATLWHRSNKDMMFGTNGERRLTIKADGKIGIGTHSPSSACHVIGDVKADGGTFYRTGIAGNAWDSGAGALTVDIESNSSQTPLILARRTADTTTNGRLFALELLNAGTILAYKMRGNTLFATHSTGMLGVNMGITGPSATLHVNGTSGRRVAIFSSPNAAGASFGPLIHAGTNSSDSAFKILNAADTSTYFDIRGDGQTTVYKNLIVKGETYTYSADGIETFETGSGATRLADLTDVDLSGVQGNFVLYQSNETNANGDRVWKARSDTKTWSDISGKPTTFIPVEHNHIGSTYVTTPSDRALKTDLKRIDLATNTILSLTPYTYNWTTQAIETFGFNNHQAAGVIAQEIESILPFAVQPLNDEFKAVDYIQIIPYLIAAFQELHSALQNKNIAIANASKEYKRAFGANEKLAKRVRELESELNNLKNQIVA